MSQSILFWKEYIKLYCSDKEQTGLTIPNIIGSVKLNTSFKEYSIYDFLNEVVNENFEILISKCPDIDELVFGKFKNWNAPKNYFKNISSIYFTQSDSQTKITELKDLIKELESQYNNRIENKTYSREENSWIYLTSEDKQNHLIVKQRLESL